MSNPRHKRALASAAAIAVVASSGLVAACGGGVSSAPGPIAAPAPSPSPAPIPSPTPTPSAVPTPPPSPPGPIGLVSDAPFAVVAASRNSATGAIDTSAKVGFRYLAAEGQYEIALPGLDAGRLRTLGYNGGYLGDAWTDVTGSYTAVSRGNSADLQAVRVLLSYPGALNRDNTLKYSGWGRWGRPDGELESIFAYGIATLPAQMPTSGTASYSAKVIGTEPKSQNYILGSTSLTFDFGAGNLTGSMTPEYCPWDCYSLGRYEFAETVFAAGSAAYSGKLAVVGAPASMASGFSGSFNGPAAAETMASWRAPMRDPTSTDPGRPWLEMYGVWVGAKGP